MGNQLSRRDALAGALAAGGLVLTSCASSDKARVVEKPLRAADVRFAHLTDMHVDDKRHAEEGFAKAVRHAQAQGNIDFIVTGGDHVMDALKTARPQVENSWKLFHGAMSETKLPVRHVIGNHDIFGWSDPTADATAPDYGVKLAMDQLKLSSSYYSFGQGNWHFAVLDSMEKRGNSYFGHVSPEQMEWLKSDLPAAKGKNLCVFTHIPILSITSLMFRPNKMLGNDLVIPDEMMIRNIAEVTDLLQSAGVKLAVAGHTHMHDRLDYKGVTYVCNGAVCGNWWKGPHKGFAEGYSVFDLFADGSVEHRYVQYGWKAYPAIDSEKTS